MKKLRTTVTFVLELGVEPDWYKEHTLEEIIELERKEIEESIDGLLKPFYPTSRNITLEVIDE